MAKLITQVPEPNLWNEICEEYRSMRPPFEEKPKPNVKLINYDPSEVTPVFYGMEYIKVETSDAPSDELFNSSSAHPACVGYAFVDKRPVSPPQTSPAPPDRKTCPPREYLQHYVFPHLLSALEAMLVSAKKMRCFERKRTKFNALDFLTEFLYKNNPDTHGEDRQSLTLFDIPFVQRHLSKHPRPPLPLSLIWTEEEACLVIQSHWRGHQVRRQAEIQELRVWQKEWREENANIRSKVEDFWADKLPESTENRDECG